MRCVIGGQLVRDSLGQCSPVFGGPKPVVDATGPQRIGVSLHRKRRLQKRSDGNPARVFAQLFCEHAACRTPLKRLAHSGVVARMLARGDVCETPSGQGQRRARHPEHEAVISPGGDGTLQVELHPALCSGLD